MKYRLQFQSIDPVCWLWSAEDTAFTTYQDAKTAARQMVQGAYGMTYRIVRAPRRIWLGDRFVDPHPSKSRGIGSKIVGRGVRR